MPAGSPRPRMRSCRSASPTFMSASTSDLALLPARRGKVLRLPVPGRGRLRALLLPPAPARGASPLSGAPAALTEAAGDPETLVVDATLLSVLHPRRAGRSAGLEGGAGEVGLFLLGRIDN